MRARVRSRRTSSRAEEAPPNAAADRAKSEGRAKAPRSFASKRLRPARRSSDATSGCIPRRLSAEKKEGRRAREVRLSAV
jgi:hypothetical protein